MSDIKIYAPVVVTTICRYETFKRCVESLMKCTGADQTELYIGVDYPSNESHWTGYCKICDYVETISGFKTVNIYKRDHNYGQSKNLGDLLKRIKEKYDRYITTEDDNEFSPNFLEYMNKGLEKFEDNPNVVFICGYNYPFYYIQHPLGLSMNSYPMKFYSAWGAGVWFNKKPYHFLSREKANEVVYSWRSIFKLWKAGHYITVHRLLFRKDYARGDLMRRVCCVLENKYCIFPAISKVRNLGNVREISTNCPTLDFYGNQVIDDSTEFDYDGFEIKSYKAVEKIQKKLSGGNILFRLICVLEYILFRLGARPLREYPLIRKILIYRMNLVNFLYNFRKSKK
ncbi:MAG: glycosyltransferase family 2 protein [Prevotella sp.]|nr:glycosyltransferase family 2 protein [Prevotella sp.]